MNVLVANFCNVFFLLDFLYGGFQPLDEEELY